MLNGSGTIRFVWRNFRALLERHLRIRPACYNSNRLLVTQTKNSNCSSRLWVPTVKRQWDRWVPILHSQFSLNGLSCSTTTSCSFLRRLPIHQSMQSAKISSCQRTLRSDQKLTCLSRHLNARGKSDFVHQFFATKNWKNSVTWATRTADQHGGSSNQSLFRCCTR